MNLRTIAPGLPFLDVLARWWLAGAGAQPMDAADGLILLPTRRAARALTESFLRASEGRPLLLPRIAALGALDEAPLALAGALDLPPAIDPTLRLAVLSRMILALRGRHGTPRTADGAWPLARDLAALLDEAHRSEVSLPEALRSAAAEGYAEHWAQIVEFLAIVTASWPDWLAEQDALDGARRALDLLDAQAASWERDPPPGRVVVAGTTGGVRAVAGLMRVVARLPRGTVVLPGLDLDMDEPLWAALDHSHPQAGLRGLLAGMGATRGDVTPLEDPRRDPPSDGERRAATIARALLPATGLARWRDPFTPHVVGLALLDPADQQEEAAAIALALRDALERPGATAALVTPDRALAGRVAAELTRFGVIVDDSAGEPLADTPPGAFLRLLARAVADGLAPVALLAVLKHPLAGFGLAAPACRALARRLEDRLLRGPAPPPGIAGLRARDKDGELAPAIDRIALCLAPLLSLTAEEIEPADALAALIDAAEAAAATDAEAGAARLWALEEGEALATHVAALAPALALLPPQPLATLPALLDATMEGAVVRSRRALRGRDGAEHPRVAILGLLESRLQGFDLLVLGGLAEGVWPAATDPGPWMSRPMRAAVGLSSPEERVGQMAHDFAALVCAAPRVVLSCPRRRGGAPSVPARWLVRLQAFLEGHGVALARHPAAHWAALLDQPSGGPRPVPPPAPRPPLALRPRRLSVTEVETWLRDPYAIYARRILRLRALDPLEQNADAADYGSVVHAALAAFLGRLSGPLPPHAAAQLRADMDRALAERALRPALAAWWRPRLHRIADWFAAEERCRRDDSLPDAVATERPGEWLVPAMTFTLTGRADRIERRGGGLAILDYKTGTLPKAADVEAGYSAQLLLEAAMARDGAFGPDVAGPTAELAYWRLTGGLPPAETRQLFAKDPAELPARVEDTVNSLASLIDAFDDPARPYLSQPHPGAAPRFSDYAQLARVIEWAVLEEDGP